MNFLDHDRSSATNVIVVLTFGVAFGLRFLLGMLHRDEMESQLFLLANFVYFSSTLEILSRIEPGC